MRFYTRQHRHYCGVDLHARSMYVCVLDQEGNVLVSKTIPSAPEPFLELIAPYREDLAVAAECMFTWYWLADLCAREGIVFVLGHALYMRAIHGGEAKNDRIGAHKNAGAVLGVRPARPVERSGLLEHFAEPQVRRSVAVDLSFVEHYDRELPALERYLESNAQAHDPVGLAGVRTIHGLGKVLGLSILYEIHDVGRFSR